jgi:SAM-dependent methyltransferase
VVFDEIARVLKPGGGCIISDLKRDHRGFGYLFAWGIGLTIPKDFRVHYWNSIHAAYTAEELRRLVARSRLTGWRVEENLMGLHVVKEMDNGAN